MDIKNDSKKLIAAMLLTDGMLTINDRWVNISYFSNDKILHEIFQKLMKEVYNTTTTSFNIKAKGFRTVYARKEHRKIAKDLLELSPSYKTSPNFLPSVEEYYKLPQPSLGFLTKDSKKLKIEAFRLAMSAEGSVCVTRRENGSIRIILRLACAHPKLAEEWKLIAKDIGINFRIGKDATTWSKIHGLQCTNSEDVKKFFEIGGFTSGVKIQRGNIFKNWEKNRVLETFINFKNTQKNYTDIPDEKFWDILKSEGKNTFGARVR